jgi:hypothetical protein
MLNGRGESVAEFSDSGANAAKQSRRSNCLTRIRKLKNDVHTRPTEKSNDIVDRITL